jgi:hypothetical protein
MMKSVPDCPYRSGIVLIFSKELGLVVKFVLGDQSSPQPPRGITPAHYTQVPMSKPPGPEIKLPTQTRSPCSDSRIPLYQVETSAKVSCRIAALGCPYYI